MNRGEIAQHQSQPLAGVSPVSAAVGAGDRMPFRDALEHMIAVTYGVTYDAVVTHFPPYEAMLEEIVAFVARSAPDSTAPRATNLTFQHFDIARDNVPGAGTFDVLVSMHTLYWHPNPTALLESCRRALKPGGHAIFLTYGRPAGLATFREVRAAEGLGAAVRALRWLLPTMTFEFFRESEHRYLSVTEFHETLARAGFEILEARQTFLSGLSRLAWCRAK